MRSHWRRSTALIAAFAASLLGLGALMSVPSASADTGTYPVSGWFTDTATPGAGAAGAFALQQPMFTLSDQVLLGSANAASTMTGRTMGWIGYYTNNGLPPTAPAIQDSAGGNNGQHTTTAGVVGQLLTTIALDANVNGHGDGKPYVYAWAWNGATNQNATTRGNLNTIMGQTIPTGSMSGTNPTANYFTAIYRWTSGDTVPQVAVAPTIRYFEPTLAADAVEGSNGGWSGGEVIQSNGRLFMSGMECTSLDASYRMMVFDPTTGAYNYSGQIKPATPDDDIFAGANSCTAQGYVASDMALDGNGNAYILVRSDRAMPSMGAATARARVWLVRVVPSDTSGGWTYNLVSPLVAAPGEPNGSGATTWAGNNSTVAANIYMSYGSAFFNGKLYVYDYNGGGSLNVVNPMSGQVSSLPANANPGNATPSYVQDLASGQTAYVLQGSVYNDANADGVIDTDEASAANALSGVQVALYQQVAGQYVLQGQRYTNGAGGYSFLLGGQGDYLVRVVRPQIGGVDAVQTWASGGGAVNTATAVCSNGNVTATVAIGADGGKCAGAVNMPIADPPLPANPVYGTESSTQPDAMPIQTMVHVSSDAVVTADFGVTAAGSFGDSSTPPTTVATGAPMHINSSVPQVWLGAALGTYAGPATDNAAHNATDDGLYVGGSSLLGNVAIGPSLVLAGGRAYTLKADVSGPQAANGSVNGWITPVGTTAWNTTAVWTPALAAGTASGSFTPATSTSTGTEQLRAQVSLGTAPVQPNNSANEYQDAAGTKAWATPGEIEDYSFRVAPAVYRPAVMVNGATVPGPVTVTPGPDNVTSATAQSFSNITATPQVGGGIGVNGGTNQSLTVDVPSGHSVSAQIVDTETGAVVYTQTVTNPSGPTATISWGPMAVNDDVTVLMMFQQPPSETHSSLSCTPAGPLKADGTASYTCTVTVADANGAKLANQTVGFWSQDASSPLLMQPADGSAAAAPTATCTTDNSGACAVDVSVTSLKSGTWHVNASVDTTMAGGPVTGANWKQVTDSPWAVTFTAGDVNPSQSTITIDSADYLDVTATPPANQHTVTVRLFDTNMNPVTPSAADVAAVCPSGVTCSTPTGSGATGVFTFTVTTPVAGSYPIQATYQGHTIGATTPTNLQTVHANFKPGLPVPPGPIVCPDGTTITADTVLANPATNVPVSDATGTGSALSAYVVDEYCNAIVGAQVSFANGTPAGSAVVTGTDLATNATTGLASGGKATDPAAESVGVAGSYTYPEMDATNTPTGVTLHGTLAPATVAFQEGGIDLSRSIFTVLPAVNPNDATMTNWVVADGTAAYIGTVTAYDSMGNPLTTLDPADFQYTITGAPAGAVVSVTAKTTDGNGHYSVKFTTTWAASTYKVTASYGGIQVVGAPTIVAGTPIPFKAGVPIPPDPPNPICEDGRLKTYTSADQTTGVPVGTDVAVHTLVTDVFCNPVTNVLVTFTPTGSAKANPTTSTVDAGGVATVNVTDEVAETIKVNTTGTANGQTDTGSVTIQFVASDPATCTTPGECVCPDGSSNYTHLTAITPVTVPGPSTATALITDKYCNVIVGAPVTFGVSSPSGHAALSDPPLQTTNSQGIATVGLTDVTAETTQVSATITVRAVNTPINGSPADVVFQPGVISVGNSSFTCAVTSGSKTPPAADDTQSYTCTIDARDSNGNPTTVSDRSLFSFSVSDPGVHTDTVAASTRGNAPIYIDHVTSTKAGALTIRAYYNNVQITGTTTDGGVTYATVTPATPIPFQAGDAAVGTVCTVDGVQVVVGQIYSGPQPWALDGSSTLISGGTTDLHAYMADADCNPITGVDVQFAAGTAPANSGVVATVIGVTGDDGWATGTVTDQKAENVPVIGTYTSTGNGSGDLLPTTVTFTAGEPEPGPFTCVIDGHTVMGTNMSVDPSSVKAGGNATAFAYVTDKNCNPVANVPVSFKATGSAKLGPSSLGTFVTDNGGLAYADVTDKRAEKVTVSGTFTWNAVVKPVGSAKVTFTAGTPSVGPFDCLSGQESTNLSAFPMSLPVGNPSTVRAYVTDKYCNPVDGVPVTFKSDGSSVLTPPVVNTDPGIATSKLTDNTAETVNVSATIVINRVVTKLPTNPPSGVRVVFTSIVVQTGGVLAVSANSTSGGASGLAGVWVGIAAWRRRDDGVM